jgi:predicted regulator of Ras-like GTPase activity (Roadblock/LC7/MglB family)
MGKIQDVVGELRQVAGVKGVAVVTHDGLVVATALEQGTSPDVIGGLASYLLMTTNKSLAEGGLGGCARLSLHATHGKAVFVDLTDSCLVVMVDQFVDPASLQREIDDAANRLRRAARMA